MLSLVSMESMIVKIGHIEFINIRTGILYRNTLWVYHISSKIYFEIPILILMIFGNDLPY